MPGVGRRIFEEAGKNKFERRVGLYFDAKYAFWDCQPFFTDIILGLLRDNRVRNRFENDFL